MTLQLLFLLQVFLATEGAGPVVTTEYGKVQGLYTNISQVFRSIPYATPPVELLRWQDPIPPKPWPNVLQATDDPPGCPQSTPCGLPPMVCPKRVSEDCLYLNVFTPLYANASSKLPVMVFIHGGNFLRGYGGGYLYDGQYIVNNTDVILVSINYRLGAIGFLVYGEGVEGMHGNYGLRDQRLALKWVQNNIANFGGDPSSVTLFGQSAGAISIAIHMISVPSAGLFHKGILESEPFGISLKDEHDIRKLAEDFARELGCGDNDPVCVRKKPISAIISSEDAVLSKIVDIFQPLEVFLPWTPWIDGIDLTANPLEAFAKGEVPPLPMIIGTVAEESHFFIYDAITSPLSDIDYSALLLAVFFEDAFQVADRYPPNKSGDNRPIASALGTDYSFACPTRNATEGYLKSRQPAWLYMFDHPMSFDGWGPNFSFCDNHSCHAVELPFVFHTASYGGFKYTNAELILSDTLIHFWTNFAKYGDPNGPSRSRVVNFNPQKLMWPQYDISRRSYLHFKTPLSEVGYEYKRALCDFWDTKGYD